MSDVLSHLTSNWEPLYAEQRFKLALTETLTSLDWDGSLEFSKIDLSCEDPHKFRRGGSSV